MTYSLLQFILLGALTLIFVGVLTPLMRALAIKIDAVDRPTLARKMQKDPVPYLGGVGIAVGVVGASYGALLYSDFTWQNFLLASSVLIPALIVAIMGLIDDLRGLQPWPRLIFQTVTAIVVSAILISSDTIGTPSGNRILDIVVTTFWVVGVCNSINFFDNLDGGASGTVAVISIFIFAIAFQREQILVSALAIVTAGATAGFLFWNRSPAKIYMGDAGALFLGIIISVLTIRLNPGIVPVEKSLAIPALLMAIPILDTTVAVVSRLRRGISPFEGGTDHLSHRLLRMGFSRRKTALSLWFLAALFGAAALLLYTYPDTLGWAIIALAGMAWIALLIFFFGRE